MNTFKLAEEIWVDPGRNGETNTHEDRMSVDCLFHVAAESGVAC
jgi:hypothetical protein